MTAIGEFTTGGCGRPLQLLPAARCAAAQRLLPPGSIATVTH
jgi:hypothetical protein